MLPISELRGAIPFGILNGLSWQFVFIIATISNIAITPFIFLFLDYLHKFFSKSKHYKYIFNKIVKRTRRRIEHKIGTKWELPALYALVAIPLPFTGAYTGVLAAWLFNIERKKALTAIILGIITAAIITTLITLGAVSFF